MSISPNVPTAQESYGYESPGTPRWITILLVLMMAGIAVLGIAGYSAQTKISQDLSEQQKQNKILTAQLDQANTRIADLKSKMEITTQRIGLTQSELAQAKSRAESIRKEQQSSDEKLTAQLTQAQKELDPKYFYDEQGSALFEQITELPEYYLTRAERKLLESEIPDFIAQLRAQPRRPRRIAAARRPQLLRVHAAKIEVGPARRAGANVAEQDRPEKSEVHADRSGRRQDHRKKGQDVRRAGAVLREG